MSDLLRPDIVIYLDVEDVLMLYADRLGASAEVAASHLIFPERLRAALDRPIQHAIYAEADLAQQAAVLADGIANNHPFDDGNKRTALGAMILFLRVNGAVISIGVSQQERAQWMVRLVMGGDAEELADRLREVLTPA